MVYKPKKTHLFFYQLFAFVFFSLAGIHTAALAQMTQEEAKYAISNFFDQLPPENSSCPQIAHQLKKVMEELIVKAARSGLTEMEVAKVAQAAAKEAILRSYKGANAHCIVPRALAAGAVRGAAKAGMNPANISLAAAMGMTKGVSELGGCRGEASAACGPSNWLEEFLASNNCVCGPFLDEDGDKSIIGETKGKGRIHIFLERKTGPKPVNQCPCPQACCHPEAVWAAANCGSQSEALSNPLVRDKDKVKDKFFWINFLERDTVEKSKKEAEDAVQEFITNSPSF